LRDKSGKMSSRKRSINSQEVIKMENRIEKSTYEFGTFRLDASSRLLFCEGSCVPLAPKVLETLLVLVERCGLVVSKDELMNLLWPDTFVEEANLTQNIFMLRKALEGKVKGAESSHY